MSSPSAIGASNPGAHVCPPNIAGMKTDIVDAVNRMNAGLDRVTAVYISCNAGAASGDPAPTGKWTEVSEAMGAPVQGQRMLPMAD